MPKDTLKPGKSNKFARTYDFNEGNVTIWYKGSTKPQENEFGKLVQSLRLARSYVSAAVRELNRNPLSKLAKDVLGVHFGANNLKEGKRMSPEDFMTICESFEEIQQGMSTQVVLCLEKGFRPGKRGETMAHGKSEKHIHLNVDILPTDDESAIARTVIHEASHLFAKMPGTETYAAQGLNGEDEDEDGEVEEELYEDFGDYKRQKPKQARACADSYAWSALSFGHGHVICSTARWKDPATKLFNDTFDNASGCDNKMCAKARSMRQVMAKVVGPRKSVADLRRSGVLLARHG